MEFGSEIRQKISIDRRLFGLEGCAYRALFHIDQGADPEGLGTTPPEAQLSAIGARVCHCQNLIVWRTIADAHRDAL